MTTTIIESLGVYLPPDVLTTTEIVNGCRLPVPLQLERLTGIESRRVLAPGKTSIDLARESARICLERSRHAPEDIDLLISCSISKATSEGVGVFEPLLAIDIRSELGMVNAVAFDVANACAGMWTGIAIADALLKSGAARCAMVFSGEWASHVISIAQREIETIMDPRIPCLTVGDAGAAVIMERSPDDRIGFQRLELYTIGKYSELCIVKPSLQEHGGLIMTTDSIRISTTSIPRVVGHMVHSIGRQGWGLDDIGHVIPHQTSRTSLQDAARQFSVQMGAAVQADDGKYVDNLTQRGNTATTTQLVALEEAVLDGRVRSGEKVAFSITGSGITIGTALYAFDDLPDRIRGWQQHPQKPANGVVRLQEPTTSGRLTRRVRVESVGTAKPGAAERATLPLVHAAAEAAFARSGHTRGEMDLLIFTGLYRTDHIIEPAIAALIAGDLGLNEDISDANGPRTFAFDLLNGALGLLNACYVASHMIEAGVHHTAMIVTAEVEDEQTGVVRGIAETGSALILDQAGPDGPGFEQFAFYSYPEHLEALRVSAYQDRGRVSLRIEQHAWLEELYLECASDAVRRFLGETGLSLAEVQVLIPPQSSSWLARALAEDLGLPSEKVVDVTREGVDLYSSSIPYALEEVQRRGLATPGGLGLIVAAGSGIQVGCAVYRF